MGWVIMVVVAYMIGCGGQAYDRGIVADDEPIAVVEAVEGRPDLVRILLDCEYACPVMPYIEVMRMPKRGEVVQTEDTDPIVDIGSDLLRAVAEPEPIAVDCVEDWDFSECCGNGTCEPEESAFFCPSDCF